MVYLSVRYSLFKKLLKSKTHIDLHQTEPVPFPWAMKLAPIFSVSPQNSSSIHAIYYAGQVHCRVKLPRVVRPCSTYSPTSVC